MENFASTSPSSPQPSDSHDSLIGWSRGYSRGASFSCGLFGAPGGLFDSAIRSTASCSRPKRRVEHCTEVGWRQGICNTGKQAQLQEILHLELGALATSTQLATSLQLQQPPQPNRKVVVFSAAAAEAATQVVAAEIAAGGASPLASKGRRVGIKFLVQVGGSWIPRWYMGVVIHKQGEDMHVQLDGADGDTAWVREDEEDWAYEGLADMRDK